MSVWCGIVSDNAESLKTIFSIGCAGQCELKRVERGLCRSVRPIICHIRFAKIENRYTEWLILIDELQKFRRKRKYHKFKKTKKPMQALNMTRKRHFQKISRIIILVWLKIYFSMQNNSSWKTRDILLILLWSVLS